MVVVWWFVGLLMYCYEKGSRHDKKRTKMHVRDEGRGSVRGSHDLVVIGDGCSPSSHIYALKK